MQVGVIALEKSLTAVIDLEDGGGTCAKDCTWPPQNGKDEDMTFPLEPPGGTQPCRHLGFRTSDLQNGKEVNVLF